MQIIISEASKAIQDAGKSWRPTHQFSEPQLMGRLASLSEGPASVKSPSKNWKVAMELMQNMLLPFFIQIDQKFKPFRKAFVYLLPLKVLNTIILYQVTGSPQVGSVERRTMHSDLLLKKIDEVNKTVKV